MKKNKEFLQGEGECAKLLREIDWSNHPLGDPDSWPDTLKISLGILLSSKFPMFLFWGENLFCFYNDSYRPSLGKNGKHPNMMGKKAHLVWPETWGVIKPQIDQVLEKGEATWNEEQFLPIYRNGRVENVYWTYSYSPVLNPEGEREGVLVTCRDATAEVQRRRSLEKMNERLKRAKKIGGIGDWSFNLETEELTWSEEMYHIFETTPGAYHPTWQRYKESVHPEDLVSLQNMRQHAIENGETLDHQHRLIVTDGSEKWVRQVAKVYESENGEQFFEGTCQDITEMKRINLELEKKAGKLKQVNEDLEEFAYTASHDLKEPLRMVKSFLDLLKQKYGSELDEKAQKYIFFARDGAARMGQLIDELLEYSRVGRIYTETEKVDLNRLLERVEKLYAGEIEEKNARIISVDLPVVDGISITLQMLLQNIISNSLKFCPDQKTPEIRIESKEEKVYWKISIADNGIGVDKLFFNKVFQPFKRLHTSDEYPGSGMGLATCKKIVEQHGGSISIESDGKSGTTIHFTIKKVDA